MKLFKRGAHARKHIPYKRGKHAQGNITIISTNTFKHMLQNNQPMLVFGKAGIGATTSVAEFFDGQHQVGPEVLNALYEITHGKGVNNMDKEEFINDYENIVNVIDNLLDDIYTKEFVDYWRDHLTEFKCEYSTTVDEYETDLTEEETREQRELAQDYWATRF